MHRAWIAVAVLVQADLAVGASDKPPAAPDAIVLRWTVIPSQNGNRWDTLRVFELTCCYRSSGGCDPRGCELVQINYNACVEGDDGPSFSPTSLRFTDRKLRAEWQPGAVKIVWRDGTVEPQLYVQYQCMRGACIVTNVAGGYLVPRDGYVAYVPLQARTPGATSVTRKLDCAMTFPAVSPPLPK